MLDPFRADAIMAGFDSGLAARRERCWIPFTVILANEGDAVSGDLVVTIHGTEVRYRTPVEMPSGSRKAVRLSVMPLTDADEYSIDFLHTGGFFHTELAPNLSITSLDPRVDIVALLSSDRGTHPRLGLLEPDGEGSRRRVLHSTSINLPEHWPTFANIDALVWDGAAPQEFAAGMTEGQYDALYTWIQMGGHLVLALGENWGEISGTPWERLLPVTFDGSRLVSTGSAVTWPGTMGRVTLGREAVISTFTGTLMGDAVTALRVKPTDADEKAVGLPLLIRRKVGAGMIDTLTVSLSGALPLLSPSTYDQDLIDAVVAPEGRLPISAAAELDDSAASFLRTQVQAELPSAWFIAGFLGVYILLVVPVNYAIFRKVGRLEWAWFMVPFWAVIFAVAAYYIGAIHQRGQVTLAEFSILEAAPASPMGRTSSLVSLYSPVRDRYNVRCLNETGFFAPHSIIDDDMTRPGLSQVNLTNIGPLSVRYDEESRAVLESILVHHWSERTMKVTHHVPLGDGIEVDLAWKGSEEITGRVRNLTGFTLQDVSVVAGSMTFPIGMLSPGQSGSPSAAHTPRPAVEQQDIRFSGRPGRDPNWGNWKKDPNRWIRDQVQPMYTTAMLDDDYGESMPFVMAFIEGPLLKDSTGETSLAVGRPVGEHIGRALVIVPFTIKTTRTSKTTVPTSAWHAKPAASQVIGFDMPGDIVLQGQQGNLDQQEFVALCQVEMMSADVNSLRIQMGFSEAAHPMGQRDMRAVSQLGGFEPAKPGTLSRMTIEMRHWRTHDWEQIKFEIGTTRREGRDELRDILISPDSPGDFVDRRDPSIRFRISSEATKSLRLPLGAMRIRMDISSEPRLPKTLEEARQVRGM